MTNLRQPVIIALLPAALGLVGWIAWLSVFIIALAGDAPQHAVRLHFAAHEFWPEFIFTWAMVLASMWSLWHGVHVRMKDG